MKKTYSKPEALEVVFETQGVIATSQLTTIQIEEETTVESAWTQKQGGWNSSNWE